MKTTERIIGPLLALALAAAEATAETSGAGYETFPVFPPFPDVAGATAFPQGLGLDFNLSATQSRAFWDFPVNGGLPIGATSLEIEASLVADAIPAGISIHLRSGGVWYDATPPGLDGARRRVGVPLRRFRDAAGAVCDATRTEVLRISIWSPGRPMSGRLDLHAVRARADVVAIAELGEPVFLDRCRALFDRAGIPYADLDASLQDAGAFEIVVLPQFPGNPGIGLAQTLRNASRKGTAFFAFYTASPLLSEVLGINPGEWLQASSGPWTAIAPDAKRLGGFAEIVPHETGNLIPPYEGPGAYAAGHWLETGGRAGRIPACVVSDRGAWFAHIAPHPTRPACEWMRRLCLKFSPDLAKAFAVSALMENEALLEARPSPAPGLAEAVREAVARRSKLEEIPLLCAALRDAAAASAAASAAAPSNEWRCVWDTRAPGRTVASWRATLDKLADHGVNAVFAFAQIGGSPRFAPPSPSSSAISLERLVSEAAKAGVAVHAWMQVLALEGADRATIAALQAEDRLVVAPPGSGGAPWLCPDQAANRQMLVAAASQLVAHGVAGVHLDYIRLENPGGCVCKASRAAFEKQTGLKPEAWPDDVVGEGRFAREYQAFQTESVTALVRDIAAAVRGATNRVALSAAVFPDRRTALRLHQDWPGWVSAGWIDVLCPMNYELDPAWFEVRLDEILEVVPAGRVAVVSGIGTHASVPGPDALAAARQIAACRRRGLAGFSFFYLDDLLLESILPALKLDDSAR